MNKAYRDNSAFPTYVYFDPPELRSAASQRAPLIKGGLRGDLIKLNAFAVQTR